MDKDSEVTSDLRDKNVQREFFNSLPYIATTSNGARKINPKVLKEMEGDKGEIEDYIFRPDFYIKTVHLLYAESEEGKKKISKINPIVDSLNKNSPDREYYKRIDGIKKEVVIESNPKAKSFWYHFLKSFDEFGNAPLHFLEAGDKFFNSDIKGAVNEASAALDSFFKPATFGFGSKLGDEVGRVRKGSDQYGSKEEVEWRQKSTGSNIESVADIAAIYLTGKFVGTGVKLLDNKINYPNLRYKEYKFLEEYKYKPISGEITSKYEDIKTYHYNATTNPGPLAIGDNPPINNFYGGMYNNASNESGMFVRMGDETYPYGSWYTKVPKNSEAQARIDLAIKKWWGDSNGEIKIRGFEADKSILDTMYYIEFPEGIPKYKGPVGYQGGPFLGGLNQEQYFIPNSRNFGKVIKSHPIK